MLDVVQIQALDNLAGAIVATAATDYRRAYKLYKKGCNNLNSINELRSFFLSGWFVALADSDGKKIMRLIEEECDKPLIKKTKHKRRKKKKCLKK